MTHGNYAPSPARIKEFSEKAQKLRELAQWLYENSEEFPAINRNAKRVLASVEMLRINLGRD
jgi:hypothetical protein